MWRPYKKMRLTYLFIISFLLIPTVNAYVELSAGDIRCNPDSTIIFSVQNYGDENLETEKVRVIIQKKEFGSLKEVVGKWNRLYFPKRDPKKEILTTFKSDMWAIDSPGEYSGIIEYAYCQESFDITQEAKCLANFKFTCYSYEYDCSLANPIITECYNDNDVVYLTFANFIETKYNDINYKNYLGFKFIGEKKLWWETNFPEGFDIKNLGKDVYLIKFPLNGEIIREAKIENKRCKTYDYTNKCEIKNTTARAQQTTEIQESEKIENITISKTNEAIGIATQTNEDIVEKSISKEKNIFENNTLIAIIILLFLIIIFLVFKNSTKKTVKACNNCEAILIKGDKFCQECGRKA